MLTLSIVARLPLAMFSIGLLVHAQRLTGSFAAAGLVTAAYAIALGLGGPALGRLVDRRGQTVVLSVTASTSLALLITIATLPAGAPLVVLVALAAGIGLATPPVGACVRTLLTDPRAFAVEASAVELCWVFGPPLALGAGALFSTGAALVGAGAVLLGGTIAFAAHPSSRAWRPAPAESRPRGGSLRSPALRALILVMGAVGAIFGATEIGVTTAADVLGNTAAAGPLLGVWGVGSLLGGVWLARRGGVAPLVPLLVALAVGHAALSIAVAERLRAGRRAAARGRRDRPHLRRRLLARRARGARRHDHRGLRLAGDRGLRRRRAGRGRRGPAGRRRRPVGRLPRRRRGGRPGAGRRLGPHGPRPRRRPKGTVPLGSPRRRC